MSPKRRRSGYFLDFEWVFLPWDWFLAGLKGLGTLGKNAFKLLSRDRWSQLFALVMVFTAVSRLLVLPDWYSDRRFHPDERWLFDRTYALSYPLEPGTSESGGEDGAGLQYGSLPLYMVAAVKDAAKAINAVEHAVVPSHPQLDASRFVVGAGRAFTGLMDLLTVWMVFLLGAKLWDRRVGLLAAAFLAFTPLNIQLAHFFTVDPYLGLFSVLVLFACAKVMEAAKPGKLMLWSILSGVAFGAALASKSAGLPLALPIVLAHGYAFVSAKPGRAGREMREFTLYGLGAAVGATLLAFFAFMPYALLHFDKFMRNQMEQQNILVKGSPEGTPYVRQYWDTMPVFFHLKNLVLYYQGLALGTLCLAALLWYLVKPFANLAGFWRRARGAAMDKPSLLLVVWVAPYLLVVGFSFAKFARYMLPITPALCLLGAAASLGLYEAAGSISKSLKKAVLAAIGLVLVFSLAYALGYVATYTRTHPWVAASQWLFGNATLNQTNPDGTTRRTIVLNETWGDDIPVDVDGRNAGAFDNRKLNIVEWDSPRKLDELGARLSESDYIIMADARAYGTYLRLPSRFPLTYAYYFLMMTDPGRLGFEKPVEFRNQPSIFGITVDDGRTLRKGLGWWADESFTLYDHPDAFVFHRAAPKTPQEIMDILTAEVQSLGLPDGWKNGSSPEMNRLQSLGGAQPAGAMAPASEFDQPNPNLGMSRGRMLPLVNPVLIWLVLMGLLGLLAAPLARTVFASFPDEGYALAKSLGLLLFSWLAFWLCSLKVMWFYQSRLWALLLVLLGCGAAWAWRERKMAAAWWKKQKGNVIFVEALFAGAFLYYFVVKAFNPNIHDIAGQGYFGGGEPLGMTYLSALTRCATFPAYDPWVAMASSSYYYFGYVLAAALTKLSGFPPSVTYNLSLCLFFSLSVVTAYGLGLALTGKRKFGIFAALASVCFGSLWTVPYLVNYAFQGGQSLFGFIGNLFGGMFSHGFIWDPTRFPQLVNGHIFEFPYFSYLYSDLHPHNMVLPFSLLLLGLYLAPFKSAAQGLKAFGKTPAALGLSLGLTALVLDAQYGLNTWNWPVFLALGLVAFPLASWVGRPSAKDGADRNWFFALAGLATVLGILLAALGQLSLAAGLGAAAAAWILAGIVICLPAKRARWRSGFSGLLVFLVLILLGWALMLPFRLHFAQGQNSIGRVQDNERQMAMYIPLAFYAFGLAGLAGLLALRLQLWAFAWDKLLKLRKFTRKRFFAMVGGLSERLWSKMPVSATLIMAWLAVAAGLVLLSMGEVNHGEVLWLAMAVALVCAGGFVLLEAVPKTNGGGEEAFVWVLGFTAMCVVAGTEMYFVADRMNTIFKFWFQAFSFMGLAFAYGAWRMLETLGENPQALAALGKGARARRARRLRSLLAAVFTLAILGLILLSGVWDYYHAAGRYFTSALLLMMLFLSLAWPVFFRGLASRAWAKGLFYALLILGCLYPVGATVARINEASGWHNPHLDGLAFMENMSARGNTDYDRFDYQLIRWLNANADTTETVLEAPGREMYQGYSRFAIYTGLPTLLGWEYQVSQQLGQNAGNRVYQREGDAQTIYTTVDQAQARDLLKKYKVRWVVVGNLERTRYGAANPGFDKFKDFCDVAVGNEGATLYKVKD